MNKLIRNIALTLPWLERLHHERNQYAAELEIARTKINSLEEQQQFFNESNNALLQASLKVMPESSNNDDETTARRLHVIGFARSGTTILMDILNSSPEVYIFSELNLHVLRESSEIFSCYGGANPIEHFISRKKYELPLLYKGAFWPGEPHDGEQVNLAILNKKYRYVGDKIATCHRFFNGIHEREYLSRFLKEESCATIFFTLRKPSDNLNSLKKMFPDDDLVYSAISLAEVYIKFLQEYLNGDRFYLIFHEDISLKIINELEDMLTVRLQISPTLIGEQYQARSESPYQWHENSAIVDEFDQCYAELYKLFSIDQSIIKKSRTSDIMRTISRITKRLAKMVESLEK